MVQCVAIIGAGTRETVSAMGGTGHGDRHVATCRGLECCIVIGGDLEGHSFCGEALGGGERDRADTLGGLVDMSIALPR